MNSCYRLKEGERLARIEATVVERTAGDRAGEPGTVGRGQPQDILDRRQTAAGYDGDRQRVGECDGAGYVQAGEGAVTRDVGVDDRRHSYVLEPASDVECGDVRGPRPALDSDAPVAGVDADGDPSRIEARRFANELRITNRSRAYDDAGHSVLEPAPHRLHVPNAAAELDLHCQPCEDPRDRRGVDRLAGEGAVEIDDMEVFESLLGERFRLRRGVSVENGRLGHVAAQKANAFAILEVDCGKKDHGRHFRKLPISPRPRVWLFSGWNCVPKMLSRATIAVTGPP